MKWEASSSSINITKRYLRCDTVPLEGYCARDCRFGGDNTREAPDRSLHRVVALSADRWSMLLRGRPIAAIGERRDPRVLDATTWRVSWRRK